MSWYRKAADDHHLSHAQCALGWRYARGEGVAAVDLGQAAHWFELAALQGHCEAMSALGCLLLSATDLKLREIALPPPLQQQQPADHEQRALVGCLPQDGRSDDAEQGEAELSWMPQFNAFVQVCPLLRAVADLVLNRYVGLYTDNGWNLEGRGRLDADL